jgi:hypothetical protein
MAEWRSLNLGPKTGAIGDDQEDAAFRRQDPPKLPQQGAQAFGLLKPMHDQNAIEKQVRKGQRILFAQQRGVLVVRPSDDALGRRHRRDGALGAGKGPQIGNGIAITQHPVVPQIGPKMMDLAGNGAVRQLAQRRFIKGGEIAHVLRHGARL